jgi:U3 small nucleolar ribonucleoprotein component
MLEVVAGQLSIFDAFEEVKEEERKIQDPVAELYKGDYVKIKSLKSVLEERGKLGSEDEWFFAEFGGKKGTVSDIHIGKVVSYQITLNNDKVVWAHGDDLIYV